MDEPGTPACNWMFGGSHIKYRSFLNGERVSVGPPRSLSGVPVAQGFDVTSTLRSGANTLGVILLGEDRGIALHLHILDVEGNEYTIVSDDTWRALRADDIFRPVCWERPGIDYFFKGFAGPGAFPEHIDGTRWPHGWLAPSFDDSSWATARDSGLADEPLEDAALPPYHFRMQEAGAGRQIAPGRYVYDLGKEVFGGLKITISAPQEGEIEVRLGEELRFDGSVRYVLRTENCYQECWKYPAGRTTLEHMGCRAFRYIELCGNPAVVERAAMQVIIPEYPWDDALSTFQCDRRDLKRVWEFCRHTIRATNFDVHTDCLTRERQPYEGDAYITALSHYALQGDAVLARRTFEYLVTHPTWPQEWLLLMPVLLLLDYWQTGDDVLARRHLDTIWGRFEPLLKGSGLVSEFPNRLVIDWPATMRDGYQSGPAAAVPNAYLHEALCCFERLFTVAGRECLARVARERAEMLREAFQRELFRPDLGLYVDHAGAGHAAFHSNLYALRFGLAAPEQQAGIVRHLVERGMACSVFTAQFVLETLFACREARTAVQWMTSETVPGWLSMMDLYGATAGMEAWSPEQKPNVSFAHPWATAPANIVASGLFGLRAASPGWETFVFDPQPGGLRHASIKLPTPRA